MPLSHASGKDVESEAQTGAWQGYFSWGTTTCYHQLSVHITMISPKTEMLFKMGRDGAIMRMPWLDRDRVEEAALLQFCIILHMLC